MFLDLEKVFDIVGRDHVVEAMEVFDLSPNFRHLINSWLLPHDCCLSHKDLVGRIRTHRGIS